MAFLVVLQSSDPVNGGLAPQADLEGRYRSYQHPLILEAPNSSLADAHDLVDIRLPRNRQGHETESAGEQNKEPGAGAILGDGATLGIVRLEFDIAKMQNHSTGAVDILRSGALTAVVVAQAPVADIVGQLVGLRTLPLIAGSFENLEAGSENKDSLVLSEEWPQLFLPLCERVAVLGVAAEGNLTLKHQVGGHQQMAQAADRKAPALSIGSLCEPRISHQK
jgi:hypothetical protein